jgi:aryl-alcohol dehydrogenase-like predicted oxidoreductase
MEQRALGGQGLTVGVQGLGCMGMSVFYGAADETSHWRRSTVPSNWVSPC